MKKILKVFLFSCLCVTLLCAQVSAAEPGNKNPYDNPKDFASVSEGRVSAETVKQGETLRFSFKLTDRDIKSYQEFEEGVFRVRVVWKSEKKQELIKEFHWKASGIYNGKLKVSKGMQPGLWRISRIELYSYGDDDDFSVLTLYNNRLFSKSSAIDLSFSEFTVQGSHKADRKAPTLDKKSLSVTKKYVNAGAKVKFRVRVKDKSSIKYVKCVWQEKQKKVGLLHTDDYKMKYNKKKKCYECTLTGSRGKDKYQKLAAIEVCDIYGNKAVYKSSGKAYKTAFSKVTVYGK